jgi:hypothetical protein
MQIMSQTRGALRSRDSARLNSMASGTRQQLDASMRWAAARTLLGNTLLDECQTFFGQLEFIIKHAAPDSSRGRKLR